MNKVTLKAKFIISFTKFLLICYEMTAGRFGELWWMNQESSSVNIIPPWFSIPKYHLGDEQKACW
jgi:hypothetical protein